jgi:hypothetical protein
MKTIDLKRQLKHLYAASARKAEAVSVPRLQFLTIDGAIEKGREPSNSPGFQAATAALYGIAYTLKFSLKKRAAHAIDYPVMALEGLWWVEDGRFDITVKDNWLYRLMILVPDEVTQADFEAGLAEVRRKRGDSPELSRLRLEGFEEGLCLQILHVGPYATEPATLDKLHLTAVELGYNDRVGLGGMHHEIYLGDPRKAAPEKLKTILRHPVEKIA